MNLHQYHEQQEQRTCTNVLDPEAGQKVILTPALQATVHSSYEDRQSVVAGVILIIAGVLAIFITCLGLGIYNIFSFLAHGIWFGIVVSKPCCFVPYLKFFIAYAR